MDDPQPKRSLADDPSFRASLPDLERGLAPSEPVHEGPAAALPRLAPTRHPVAPRTALPTSVAPPPPSHRAATAVSDEPARRRPLLDLFPPLPSRADPEAPAIGTPSGPRIARIESSRSSRSPGPAPGFTYETFYGLNENPFRLSVDLKFLYQGTSHERCRNALLTAIKRGDTLVQVTGEKGIGKTTLCRAVTEELDRRMQISYVADSLASVDDLLKRILMDFGVMSRADLTHDHLSIITRAELTTTLRNYLESLAFLRASAVVIVDAADALPPSVLAEIRSLADSMSGERLLQVVLVGDVGEHAFNRIELGPLAADEIHGYVMHRVRVAGERARVAFSDPAYAKLFQASRGVSRTVNLLCDRALTLARKASVSVIDKALIEEAARSLELARPIDGVVRVLRFVLVAAVLVLLMLVGARAALWVFRDRVAQTVLQWTSVPPSPASPPLEPFVPLDPISVPDENAER